MAPQLTQHQSQSPYQGLQLCSRCAPTTLPLPSLLPILVSLLLIEHPDMLWPQGLCTYGFFWLESSPLPFCQVSLNSTLLERFSLTTSCPPALPYPVLYFPMTCITTLSIHLFDCLLSRPTATTGDHKLHEGRHFCCVYCYVFSTKQHPDL